MGRRALILEAHHTTHIEGTQLTLEQAERLMAGSPVPEANPDDVRELMNYREAFEFVSEVLEYGGSITEGLIREIHKRLVEGVRGGRLLQGSIEESRTTWSTQPPGRRCIEENVGCGAIGFRGSDQRARLPTEEDRLKPRQSCDTTCDILTTRLATACLAGSCCSTMELRS